MKSLSTFLITRGVLALIVGIVAVAWPGVRSQHTAAAPDREQEPDRFGEQASADGFQDLGRGLPAVGLDTHRRDVVVQ